MSKLKMKADPETKARQGHAPAKPARPPAPKKIARAAAATNARATTVRGRIDVSLKEEAEAILEGVGLNSSEAIRLLFKQIVLHKGLPFPVSIPNAETIEAMREAEAGGGTEYASAAEMFKAMGI